ncbi:MAG TPA: class III extradiol dioxygenase family protein [Gammaproteobacteria bacterium]
MARIVGAVTTSHIPAIGNAISAERQDEPYWSRFFQGYDKVVAWLNRIEPDVAVMVFNDHGLNFFLDNLPTFAVGAAAEYRSEDEGWGLPTFPPYRGAPELSWHVIESLVEDEFDIATCQEMLVDHAFINPMRLLWPNQNPPSIATVPVAVNTVQHPLPKPSRCFRFGVSLGAAIESYDEDLRVVVIGTGGMSHQLDGERAGFINKEFDMLCMDKLVDDPEALTRYSIDDIVRLAGTQGVEIINWIVARATLSGRVEKIHSSYHIPISNTAAGVLALEHTR